MILNEDILREASKKARNTDEEIWRTTDEGKHYAMETETGEITKGEIGQHSGKGSSKNSSGTRISSSMKPKFKYDLSEDMDIEEFTHKNIDKLKKIYDDTDGDMNVVNDEYYKALMDNSTKDLHEISKDEADSIMADNVRQGDYDGWFREANSDYKPRLTHSVLSSKEMRNAALNLAYENYKMCVENPLSFDKFLTTPIEVYRGGSGQKHVESDVFSAYSFDKKMAESFMKGDKTKLTTAKVRPIDTFGSMRSVGEAEIWIPRSIAENGEFDSADDIQRFRQRRDARLDSKRKLDVDYYKYRRSKRLDANGSEQEEEEEGGSSGGGAKGGGGGHGNTRLPYGLCKANGIDLPEGATPRDAWDALRGIGITPDSEYAKLKEKGKVEEPVPVKRDTEKYTEVRIGAIGGGKYGVSYSDKDGISHREPVMTEEEVGKYFKEHGIDTAKIRKEGDTTPFKDIEEKTTDDFIKKAEIAERLARGEKIPRDYDMFSKVSIRHTYSGYDVEWKTKGGDVKEASFADVMGLKKFLDSNGIETATYEEGYAPFDFASEEKPLDKINKIAESIDKKTSFRMADGTQVDMRGVPDIQSSGIGFTVRYKTPNNDTRTLTLTNEQMREFLSSSGLSIYTRASDSSYMDVDKLNNLLSIRPSVTVGDQTYTDLSKKYSTIYGYDANGERRTIKIFESNRDLLQFMADNGIQQIPNYSSENITDISDYAKVEDAHLFGDGYMYAYYTDMAIGYKGDSYTVYGTRLDGEKKIINTYTTYDQAATAMKDNGVEKYKVTGKAKSEYKAMLERFEAGKASGLYNDPDYGEISGARLRKEGGVIYCITGMDKTGAYRDIEIGSGSYDTIIERLKSDGVTKIMDISGTTIDPTTFVMPAVVGHIGTRDVSKFEFTTRYGRLSMIGCDVDGSTIRSGVEMGYDGDVARFEKELEDYGLSLDSDLIETDEPMKETIAKLKDFKEKSVKYDGRFYTDYRIEYSGGYFELKAKGYDGKEKEVAYSGTLSDLYSSIDIKCEDKDKADIKLDETAQKEKDRLDIIAKEFDSKAVDVDGEKYMDVKVTTRWGDYILKGTTRYGKEEYTTISARELDDFESEMKKVGYDIKSFPMDENAAIKYANDLKARADKAEREAKIKTLMSDGKHFRCGKKDDCFGGLATDESYDGKFSIWGTNVDGIYMKIAELEDTDELVSTYEDWGVTDYSFVVEGKTYTRPKDGMRGCTVEFQNDGHFTATCITGSDKTRHEAFRGTEEECRKFFEDNGVCMRGVRTVKPLSSDLASVDRSESAKYPTLKTFDEYRRKKIDSSYLKDVSYEDKEEGIAMMKEVLTNGSYKFERSPKSFMMIIENGYLSQIEVGHGGEGACESIPSRKEASEKYFGHEDTLDKHDYEKYGYLGLEDDVEDINCYEHPSYGGDDDVTYTLKKERVKDRTTYTMGDSLNTKYNATSAGFDGDSPSIEGFTSMYGKSEYNKAISYYRQYKEGKISYREMFDNIRRLLNNRYIELQYHGDVGVEDFDRVTFKSEKGLAKALTKGNEEKIKYIYSKLKSNAVKLYYIKDGKLVDGFEYIERKHPSVLEVG